MTSEKKTIINVQGVAISVLSKQGEDYISLTNMIEKFGNEDLIYNWLRNRNTLEFLGIWEQMHNTNFKGVGFDTFKNQAGLNSLGIIRSSQSVYFSYRPHRGR